MRISYRRLIMCLIIFLFFYIIMCLHQLANSKSIILQNIIFKHQDINHINDDVKHYFNLINESKENDKPHTIPRIFNTLPKTKFVKPLQINRKTAVSPKTTLNITKTQDFVGYKQLNPLDQIKNLTSYKAYYNSKNLSLQGFQDSFISIDDPRLKSLFPPKFRGRDNHEDRILKQLNLKLNTNKKKTILMWDSENSISERSVIDNKCYFQNCFITKDRDQLNKVDAVIFKYIPPRGEIERPHYLSHQVWIMYQLESAIYADQIEDNVDYINWTATYRSDSVLNTPYEKFATYNQFANLPVNSTRDFSVGKSKLIAWFVSNCGGMNGRLAYVEELQKHVNVDIYGYCGSMQCGGDECFEMLNKDYKFYLSFENSNCRDYISEKFFNNALRHNVVPIVMGAHIDDYTKLAPPQSFIHVDQFHGPKQLAEYIKKLDRNPDMYNEYFRWKGTGEFINTKFICRLCAMLQLSSRYTMWYSDLRRWWSLENSCAFPDHKKHEKWSKWRSNNTSLSPEQYIVRRF